MDDASQIGSRIRQRREELGLSLSRLSELAGVSKGYLWNLENGGAKSRPSGQTLYRLAEALGVTMSDLLGRRLLLDSPANAKIPPTLEAFAQMAGIPETDKRMLARVSFRGAQPQTVEDWEFVYSAIQRSVVGAKGLAHRPTQPAPAAPVAPKRSKPAGKQRSPRRRSS